MGKLILLLNVIAAIVYTGYSEGEENISDTLVVVDGEATLDLDLVLALVRRTNGDVAEGLLETSFQDLQQIAIQISDDSPDDGEAGGAVFGFDVLIYDHKGNRTSAREKGLLPLVEGGFRRLGFLAADGQERINIRFDFSDENYTGPEPSEIDRVIIQLVLANDYLIEVFINGALEGIAGALGNVKDGSNQAAVLIEVIEKEQGDDTLINSRSWGNIKGL